MYSCWHVDHTKRPSAPEIVDFLAMNPRIIAPCLDVPLSSVQLEHTAQLDIQLSENTRKFSVLWPQRSSSQTQGLKFPNSPTPLLLDLNGQDDDQTLDSLISQSCEQDSSSPLLCDSTRASVLKQAWLHANSNKDNEPHRYVNLQPGMLKLPSETVINGSAGNIQMEERTSMLSKKSVDTDDVSAL